MFIYGHDYRRKVALPSPLEVILSYWFIPFWFLLTTIALHLIRMKLKIRGNSISSSILFMITIFFGGGAISARHKFEKYFTVVLLFGMFFLESLWVSDFLSKMSSSSYLNSVNTLQKLSKLNTPIYFSNTFREETENVIEIVK